MKAEPDAVRVEGLAANPQLIEQVGLLRWREWAYGAKDPSRFIDTSRIEAGDGRGLPLTLVAIGSADDAVGVVGLDAVDDELSEIERAGRTPWILGMVVAENARLLGVGRLLLQGLQEAAAGLGHGQTWVATGKEAVGFYLRCGWQPVEQVKLASTGIATTMLTKPTTTGRVLVAGSRRRP